MTSLNAFVLPEAVHIITDGAIYSGNIIHPVEAQKVAILGNLPAVIGVRGALTILPSIIASVSQNVNSFDELLSTLPDLFKAVCNKYWDYAGQQGDRNERRAHFVIAGWSAERNQLEAYTLASEDMPGMPAWKLTYIDGVLVGPADADFFNRLGELRPEELIDDTEGFAIRLTQLQRESRFKNIETGLPTVGGDFAAGRFVQLTTLTRDGISTRIVKRWI